MKTIAVKLDDYLLEVITQESRERKTTRMELIRTAIIDFLLHRDDAAELVYIKQHRKDRLRSFAETFGARR